jgi:NADH-ubiquinone oxidoreductase chain 2
MCKALINDKLSEDFYQRISAIILLLSAILSYNCLFISVPPLGGEGLDGVNYNLDFNLGIGIYSGLFHITSISQILEIFLLIIGSIILIS